MRGPLRRTASRYLGVACVAALAVACGGSGDSGGSGNSDDQAAPPPPATSAAGGGGPIGPAVPPDTNAPLPSQSAGVASPGPDGVTAVVINAHLESFDPPVVTVPHGKVRFVLKNEDAETHNLVFPDAGDARSPDAKGGQSKDVTVVFDKPGKYNFLCTYHALVGMTGQLVVE